MRNSKRWLAALLAGAMALGLAACGQSSSSDSETSSSADTSASSEASADTTAADKETYLNCLLDSEPSSLDVAKYMDIQSRSVLWNILEPLTRIEDGQVVGAGAESWEVSEDGTTYTFTLRENYWSDGKQVVAGDYLYALQREADPENAWSLASDMSSIANFSAIFEGSADISELGVEAPDDKTLVITLEGPDGAFLTNVDIFPCRQDIVEQYGDSYGSEADEIVGCGPFNLTEWVHSSSLTFEKSDTYWDKDSVNLDTFTFYIMEDLNAKMSSFENGSLDYVSVSNSDYIAKFSADSNLVSKQVSAARTYMLVFNCADEVFANQKIRLAFALSIDRESLATVVTGGTAVPATGLIPPESSVGGVSFRDSAGDLVSALAEEYPDPKALLIEGMEELGLGSDPSQLTVDFAWGSTSSDARTYAELYQQMWQDALGVNVTLTFNDSTTHRTNINSGDYQIASTSWGANIEPWFQLSRWANQKGGQSNWVNSEYLELVNAGAVELDDEKRLDLYRQAEELLVSEAAIAPVYWTGSIRFSYSYVTNFTENPFDTVGMKYISTADRA